MVYLKRIESILFEYITILTGVNGEKYYKFINKEDDI